MKVNIKWNICRICLEEVASNGKSIFEQDDDKQEICAKIRECGGINIYRKSNLPSIICKTCLAHLNIAFRFRNVCQSSDEKLQTFLDKTEILNQKTPECSFLEIDDIILNEKHDDDQVDMKNDDDQYFVYFAEPEDIEEHDIVKDTEHKTSEIIPQLKQEYTLDEEYIIETVDEHAKNSGFSNQTKLEDIYQLETSLENEVYSKDDNICDDATSNDVDMNEKSSITEETCDLITEEISIDKKERKKKREANDDNRKFVCEVCGNQYDRKYSMQQHMKWHSTEKPFACELCGKAFVTEYQIHRHMRVHTGEKPYKCQYCERKFSDASSRMKHERIHTNVRPFKCDVCSKSFNYSDVLRVHKMTHSGEKPYACELCGKRFSQMHHLKAHLQTLAHKALVDSEGYQSNNK